MELSLALMLILLLLLLFSGLRVAFALGIIGLLGLVLLCPGLKSPERLLGTLAWSAVNKFTLTPLPLFVVMGELLIVGKMGETLYETLSIWLQNIRGGVCHATTISCAIFAAMSGSSIATSATLGRIAAPEMIKQGISRRLTYGAIAAGGTLGILIPPSVTMIIYGNLAGVSIGHCFIAGVIPGILATLSFILLVAIWGKIVPNEIRMATPLKISLRDKLARSIKILSPIGVIVAVLGGIYFGVTTPTEAAAVGALCALILSIAQRELTWRKLWKAALSTVQVTSYILLIVASASVVSFVMQYLRIPEALTEYVIELNLSKYVVIASFVALYFVLGMLIDPISMMVMTVPTLLPTVVQMGFDPIWFAVVVTMMCEIGNITPPVGMNLYVVQGVCNASLAEVSIGSAPFVLALLIDVAIITAYPIIATWLPSIM